MSGDRGTSARRCEIETRGLPGDDDSGIDFDVPVAFEVTDVLDLHTFPPAEVKHLVRDYLDLAYEKGLRELRIIHGKGVGVQRQTVRKVLERDPRVVGFGDPPGESGGWGATWVRLKVSPLDPP